MILSEHFEQIGRAAAYHPKMRKLTGSVTSAIFLELFLCWTGSEKSQDGWIYKTAEEIEEETGLSYEEQKTARKRLKTLGFIDEKYQRLNHRMYFRVNKENCDIVWSELFSRTRESLDGERGNSSLDEQGNPSFDPIYKDLPRSNPQEMDSEANNKKKKINYQPILQAWEEHCVPLGLPKPIKITPKRKERLKACASDPDWMGILDEAIAALVENPFNLGDNDRDWKADIDYLIRPGKAFELVEKHRARNGTRPSSDKAKSSSSEIDVDALTPEARHCYYQFNPDKRPADYVTPNGLG